MRPLLIYIHGFNSSSQSAKALEIKQFLLEQQLPIDYLAPSFSNYPGLAHNEVEALLDAHKGRQIALVGSSLGGFMATVVAERHGLKACLINPAVTPSLLIPFLLGDNTNEHTGEHFFLDESHTAEIKALELPELAHPEQYLVMLQTGDETLDYRQARDYYQQSKQIVEEGGTHRFEGFAHHLPEILAFLNLV